MAALNLPPTDAPAQAAGYRWLDDAAGQQKPQQGITPTDFRQNRRVTIKSHVPITTAVDRLLPDDRLVVKDNTLGCEVPAGGVRVIEVR